MIELYRDDHLVAISKPVNMSVHRGEDPIGPFALQAVRNRYGRRVYPVHRLDRATSGVLVFAFDTASAAALAPQFADGRAAKHYLALVRGRPAAAEGEIDRALDDKAALTRYRVRESIAVDSFRYSTVDAWPGTGRRHQIRRHLKHITCPLIGDVRYGKGEHNRLWRERFGLHRLGLHAWSLSLQHPSSGLPLHLLAPLPTDLLEPLQRGGFADLPKIS